MIELPIPDEPKKHTVSVKLDEENFAFVKKNADHNSADRQKSVTNGEIINHIVTIARLEDEKKEKAAQGKPETK